MLAAWLLPGQTLARTEPEEALDAIGSDIVLIIDHSRSMEENDPALSRLAAAKLFIDLASPGDRIGIVLMTEAPAGRASSRTGTRALTRRMVRIGDKNDAVIDTRELKDIIDSIQYEPMGNFTHIGTSLQIAYDLLDELAESTRPPNKNQFVVLLTDGKPTQDVGERNQNDMIEHVVNRFESRRHWKIFSIALGQDADPAYLQHAIAAPSGGTVIETAHASELLDAYLDIYALAEDDRFIDRIMVPSNTLTPLVQVRPDHQATMISVVVIPDKSDARIRRLQAPDERDVVDPSFQNIIRRGAEPEYELYTVPPEAHVRLQGLWHIHVDRADHEPQRVVVLSHSRLRIHMTVPPPLDDDETSVRYHPVGRPIPFVVGAMVATHDPDGTPGQPFRYTWVHDMTTAPAVQVIAPQQQPVQISSDHGREYDVEHSDGQHTLLHPALTTEATHTIRVEVAPRQDMPIHVYRDFALRITALPTMTMSLSPPPANRSVNTLLTGVITLPSRPDIPIEEVTFPPELAFVRRPDGGLDPLTIARDAHNRHQFTYTPSFAGIHRISVIANVQGRGSNGPVRYTDYVEQSFTVQEAPPQIAITPIFEEAIVMDTQGRLHIPLSIESHAFYQDELLTIRLEGLNGQGQVIPDTLLIEPSQLPQQRTILVHLPEQDQHDDGELKLILRASNPQVELQSQQIVVPFAKAFPGTTIAMVMSILVVGIGAYLYRRRTRR
jgi:Mg-chelatase subunit ChlD